MIARSVPPLLAALACLSALALAGCAEAVHGPRVVTYSEDRFYVRYLPGRNSATGVRALADERCGLSDRVAVIEATAKYTWIDVRDTTFACVRPPADPQPSIDPAPVDPALGDS